MEGLSRSIASMSFLVLGCVDLARPSVLDVDPVFEADAGAMDAPRAGGDVRPADLVSSGTPCTLSGACASGFCVDGVCCQSACDKLCQACNVAGSVGTCALIPSGSDPANVCPLDPATSCGRDGFCDGKGACRLHTAGTRCEPGSCTGTFERQPRSCDGAGACLPAAPRDCGPYTCEGTTCGTSCSMQPQCREGWACSGTICEKVDATGLVGYWRFDEASGPIAKDVSGKGNDGRLPGASPPMWEPGSGRFRGALRFNGSDTWLSISQTASLDSIDGGEITLAAWVWVEPSGTGGTVLHRQAGDTPFEHYGLVVGVDRKIRAYFNNHTPQGFLLCPNSNLPGPINSGQWTHVAATIGGGRGRVFINGIKVCDENRTTTFGGYSRPAAVGAQLEYADPAAPPIYHFRGLIDEAMLWRRALSEIEVRRLWGGAQPAAAGSTP